MGAQKNVPEEQNVKLLGLTCMFVKRKSMKLIKISVLTTPTTANVKRRFSVLTFPSTKLRNKLAPNSLDKLMQLISLEYHTFDLDRDEITDLDKFLKKPHSTKLMQLSYSHLKILKLKVTYASKLFFAIK